MEQTATISAWFDMSGTKPQVKVDGTVLVYASKFDISVEKAVPQGINPTILLLNVKVAEQASPRKGTMQAFHKTIPWDGQWKSVQAAFQYDPGPADGRAESASATIDPMPD